MVGFQKHPKVYRFFLLLKPLRWWTSYFILYAWMANAWHVIHCISLYFGSGTWTTFTDHPPGFHSFLTKRRVEERRRYLKEEKEKMLLEFEVRNFLGATEKSIIFVLCCCRFEFVVASQCNFGGMMVVVCEKYTPVCEHLGIAEFVMWHLTKEVWRGWLLLGFPASMMRVKGLCYWTQFTNQPNNHQHIHLNLYKLEKHCLSLTCLIQLNPFEISNGPIFLVVVVMIACPFRQAKRVQLHTEYSTRLLQADEDRFQLVREHPKGPRRGMGRGLGSDFPGCFSTRSSCFGPQFLVSSN